MWWPYYGTVKKSKPKSYKIGWKTSRKYLLSTISTDLSPLCSSNSTAYSTRSLSSLLSMQEYAPPSLNQLSRKAKSIVTYSSLGAYWGSFLLITGPKTKTKNYYFWTQRYTIWTSGRSWTFGRQLFLRRHSRRCRYSRTKRTRQLPRRCCGRRT